MLPGLFFMLTFSKTFIIIFPFDAFFLFFLILPPPNTSPVTVSFFDLWSIGIFLRIIFSPGIDDAIEKQSLRSKQCIFLRSLVDLAKRHILLFLCICYSVQTSALIHKSVLVHHCLYAGTKQLHNDAGQRKKRNYISWSKGDKLGRVVIPLLLF